MSAAVRPLLGAQVSGPAAVVIAKVLEEHLPARVVRLRMLAERGRLSSEWVAETLRAYEGICEAARLWNDTPAVAVVTTERLTAGAPELDQSEVSTETAADLLGVTPNRVRQLLRDGAINGRHVGRTWVVDLADVTERGKQHGRL